MAADNKVPRLVDPQPAADWLLLAETGELILPEETQDAVKRLTPGLVEKAFSKSDAAKADTPPTSQRKAK